MSAPGPWGWLRGGWLLNPDTKPKTGWAKVEDVATTILLIVIVLILGAIATGVGILMATGLNRLIDYINL